MAVQRVRLVLLAICWVGVVAVGVYVAEPASSQDDRPNILVIVTDDQRETDTLAVMRRTLEWFGAGGRRFTNAFATTPRCCPSRASIFTGRFAHNHGVVTNQHGWRLDHRGTVQRLLDERGYQTAIIGKFLNEWPLEQRPPYFDRWALTSGEYFGYRANVDGLISTQQQYQTDFLADRAVEFVSGFERAEAAPWFLYVAPYAPHSYDNRYPAEPAYANAPVPPWNGNPAVPEKDRSDKPPHVRASGTTPERAAEVRAGQLRMLYSVDDLVGSVFDALAARGELDNTVAIFTSDNGYFWGEHGLEEKNEPYLPAVTIPLFLRWPGRVAAGSSDARLVANIDIAPTILDATGVPADPAYPIDGQSLLGGASRARMLTESWPEQLPDWAALNTGTYQYVERYGANGGIVFREFYDLRKDPWQLENTLGDRARGNDPNVALLHQQLIAVMRCAGQNGPTSCAAALSATTALCPGLEALRGRHVVGTPRRDVLRGSRGRDVLCGLGGRDRLVGGRGNDWLAGGGGRDLLLAGPGRRDVCDRRGRGEVHRGCEFVVL